MACHQNMLQTADFQRMSRNECHKWVIKLGQVLTALPKDRFYVQIDSDDDRTQGGHCFYITVGFSTENRPYTFDIGMMVQRHTTRCNKMNCYRACVKSEKQDLVLRNEVFWCVSHPDGYGKNTIVSNGRRLIRAFREFLDDCETKRTPNSSDFFQASELESGSVSESESVYGSESVAVEE
jgi:hypothetical protein